MPIFFKPVLLNEKFSNIGIVLVLHLQYFEYQRVYINGQVENGTISTWSE
jgi:hypothetical protein